MKIQETTYNESGRKWYSAEARDSLEQHGFERPLLVIKLPLQIRHPRGFPLLICTPSLPEHGQSDKNEARVVPPGALQAAAGAIVRSPPGSGLEGASELK